MTSAPVSTARALVLALLLCGLPSAGGANGPPPPTAGDAPAEGAEATPAPPPASDCAAEIVARVQARYETVRDMTADFEQTTRSVSLGSAPLEDPASSRRGRVVFAKPGRMRWEYAEPEPSLVVSDGEILWLYDVGAGEAQRFHVSGGFLSGAAIQFLLGEGLILDEFRVSAGPCGGDRVRLELVPRRDATYERLEIQVDRETALVGETAVTDLFGNVTRVRFHGVEINGDPGDAPFRFEPPAGVDVIEIRSSP